MCIRDRSYRVPKLWGPFPGDEDDPRRDSEKFWNLYIQPDSFQGYIQEYSPNDYPRKGPLGLPFPSEYSHKVVVNFHQRWTVAPEKTRVSRDWVDYTWWGDSEGQRATVQWGFKILKDHLRPEKVPEAWKDLREISNKSLGYQFTAPHGFETQGNGWELGIVMIGFFILVPDVYKRQGWKRTG